eukprot:CAMPEP_0179144656 /NCGR_PEP_ID=MMETSP0796-20121207/69715_1 /TAXON_ID=73915 /ORGANISM="Pyrodinium bahamense, Strain pbaha01" /LENGTH=114 /DNA_ID=CAMNT_0020844919 /DNA_START=88 /DNA_END=429 /DNA_ORIENTATION=+
MEHLPLAAAFGASVLHLVCILPRLLPKPLFFRRSLETHVWSVGWPLKAWTPGPLCVQLLEMQPAEGVPGYVTGLLVHLLTNALPSFELQKHPVGLLGCDHQLLPVLLHIVTSQP